LFHTHSKKSLAKKQQTELAIADSNHGHCSLRSSKRANQQVRVFPDQQIQEPGMPQEQEEPGIAPWPPPQSPHRRGGGRGTTHHEFKDACAAQVAHGSHVPRIRGPGHLQPLRTDQNYRSVGSGSKIVIISRLEKAARFGTVNNSPIRINGFSQEEYSYLFKVLAFGSADPGEHPRLALIGKELATMMQGSLVHLNVYSNMLRGNLSVQFWTRVLKLYKTVMEANLTSFGERPTALLQRGGVVDITEFSSSLSDNGSVRVMLLIAERVDGDSSSGGSGELLPKLGFGDIIAGSVALPMEFELVWESRLPPYTVISATCVARKAEHSAPPRKRCRRLSTPL
ncbi:hypothetical protein BRADI_1g31998v3, partial [Brachypodium distachyon]